MCYSAEASFIASGALAGCSVAIARLPKERGSLPLSLVPAFFAAHQFAEGVVWMNQDGVVSDTTKSIAVVFYALIAYVLWPIYIPFTAFWLESDRRRRLIILICQGVGLWAGLTILVNIIRFPIGVTADCCNLAYQVRAPEMLLAPYLFAVSVPFLVSRQKSLMLFGIGIMLSCTTAAYLASMTAFPSVWCFFAAILSGGLYLHFRYEARRSSLKLQTSEHLGEVV